MTQLLLLCSRRHCHQAAAASVATSTFVAVLSATSPHHNANATAGR
jgi:hypothetical protein